jgi:hypothetical protein
MKFKNLIIFLFFLYSYPSFSQKENAKAFFSIQKNMQAQESSWNSGDVDGYMAYYWNSDSLKFIGKSGITYGWKTTLEHYKKSYPDKAAMGKLIFADLKMEKIKRKLVMVTGSWKLTREKDTLQGYYSLLWKKINGNWYIIVDHTS